MNCTKCPNCKVEPRVILGEQIEIDGIKYHRHIFRCADPQSVHYNDDIMQSDTSVTDNTIVIEKEL